MDYASIIFRIVGDEKQNYARIMGEQFFKKNIIGKLSLIYKINIQLLFTAFLQCFNKH